MHLIYITQTFEIYKWKDMFKHLSILVVLKQELDFFL